MEFECAQCGDKFVTAWSDEDARAEARANGFDPDAVGMAIVCDDCYTKDIAPRFNLTVSP